jgi:hypothetical protein
MKMEILMIGNGFDLAHGLKTGYKDFMNFIEFVRDVDKYTKKHGNAMWGDAKLRSSVMLAPYKRIYRDGKKGKFSNEESDFYSVLRKKTGEFYKNWKDSKISISDNLWFKHFEARKDALKGHDKWIDFEAEIGDVVKVLEGCFDEETGDMKGESGTTILVKIVNAFEEMNNSSNKVLNIESNKYIKLKDVLLKDLNALTNLFEMYLNCIVSAQSIKLKSPDITRNDINAVISFNYTDKYTTNYEIRRLNTEKDSDYIDYVHGEARVTGECNPEANTMILGIDDYLNEYECNINTMFIRFKKYFQRIHKKTGNKYKDWLEKTNRTNESNLYIFGHSLGMSDRDIIKELVTCEGMTTTVYYHDDESCAEKIENLVKIIGKDEVIRKVADGEVIFEKQMEMRPM